jgi:hypothetical protein
MWLIGVRIVRLMQKPADFLFELVNAARNRCVTPKVLSRGDFARRLPVPHRNKKFPFLDV